MPGEWRHWQDSLAVAHMHAQAPSNFILLPLLVSKSVTRAEAVHGGCASRDITGLLFTQLLVPLATATRRVMTWVLQVD